MVSRPDGAHTQSIRVGSSGRVTENHPLPQRVRSKRVRTPTSNRNSKSNIKSKVTSNSVQAKGSGVCENQQAGPGDGQNLSWDSVVRDTYSGAGGNHQAGPGDGHTFTSDSLAQNNGSVGSEDHNSVFDKYEHLINICEKVEESGVPNYVGCRFPVNSRFDCKYLEEQLEGYHDKEVVQLIKYGFPIGYVGPLDEAQDIVVDNHKGARENEKEVDRYLAKEVGKGSLAGPFPHNPFSKPLKLMPLNTTDKKNSTEKRVISDGSYPPGRSVNDGIPKGEYLGEEITLKFSKVDDVCNMIWEEGQGCLLWKRDMKSWFRQFRVCPGDARKLGYKWKGEYYVDIAIPMGIRTGTYIAQRIANALLYIHHRKGHRGQAYIDDFYGARQSLGAHSAFFSIKDTFKLSGAEENEEKEVWPDNVSLILGLWFNTISMTMEIGEERLKEIKRVTSEWTQRETAKRKEVESLVGLLSYVSKCVRPSRIFLSRMLDFLASMPKKGEVNLTDEFHRDLYWWSKFVPLYNGVSLIPPPDFKAAGTMLATDACLSGCGGYNNINGQYFHVRFPDSVSARNLHINVLELLAIMVAIKLWGTNLKGHRFEMQCDSSVAVAAMNLARIKDPFSQAIMREIVFWCAIYQVEVYTHHISGYKNEIADCLSRWHKGEAYERKFWEIVPHPDVREVVVNDDVFEFTGEWY